MPSSLSPREQIDKLLDLLRRSVRYAWLVIIVAAVGGALSVLLALSRSHQYESETVLFHRELIPQSVVQGREVLQSSSTTLAARYKEMLLARSNLVPVIDRFKLFPDVVEDEGPVAAADELRTRITFKDKGAGTFRIAYKGESPEEAQQVTDFLAERLKQADNQLRREQAEVTVTFLESEKSDADTDLKAQERTLAEFLSKHPEFAEEGIGAASRGAGIRAAQQKRSLPAPSGGGDTQLSALERQRRRIEMRLASPDKPVQMPVSPSKTPEQKDAERLVADAQRDLRDKLQQFTEKHPDVVAARARLAEAQKMMLQASGTASPATEVLVGPVDPEALRRELGKVESEISQVRSRRATAGAAAAPTAASKVADDVVMLETEWARLQRAVEEGRERVSSLESRVFTAQISASSEFSDAAQLSVIDKAFVPARPFGKPRKFLALAGTVLFGAFGVALALGLALIDDRIYRRSDLERLGVAPVLIEVPAERATHRRNRRG